MSKLIDVLQNHAEDKVLSFAMPGHKTQVNQYFNPVNENFCNYDVTEIPALADGSILLNAESEMAKLCRAKRAYFLQNGATEGIIAAMFALAEKENAKIILPRNVHKSFWNALALTKAEPIWLPVYRHGEYGIIEGIARESLELAITENPDAVAVVFVHPSYYGLTNDLRTMLKISAENGLATLVDEAHGAHFSYVGWPEPATDCGASLIVQSWHKTMGSLTQTAVLLQNATTLPVEKYLNAIRTTSPNYLLAASIDASRENWQENRDEIAGKMLKVASFVKRSLLACNELMPLTPADFPWPVADVDPTKIIVASKSGYSGKQIFDALLKAGVEPEMWEEKTVLFLIGAGDEIEMYTDLKNRLAVAEEILTKIEPKGRVILEYPEAKMAMLPYEAMHAEMEEIDLEQAENRVAAECITAYPPGIPVCGMGEIISAKIIHWLRQYQLDGGNVQGITADRVKVVK